MNSLWNKLRTGRLFKNGSKRLALSVVILCEVIAIAAVATFAWVETVSSIKITNEANTVGLVKNDTKYTDMLIGDKPGTINLLDYFESAGDMHLAPASSADGKTFYFPKVNDSTNFANLSDPTYNVYRKGNVSDKNTTYLSASFRLKADTNADFFFTSTPEITVSDDIRVSVTAYTEGDNPEGKYDPVTGKLISNTKIYANNASTTPVVNATDGATGATTVEKFTDHQKGKSSTYRLFAVGANETKIVTINVWLQKKTSDDTDLTANMSAAQAITNLGITSSLTPRHVTLIPTPTWDTSTTEYFYAWCWGATNGDASRLYKLELDDNEHYGFDYNGTYQQTLFLRSGNANLTKEFLEDGHWNDNTVWNKTENTSIPNDPVDPTFIIETINGSTEDDDSKKDKINDWDSNPNGRPKKSTGSWHDPAIIKVATCTGQSSWGTLTATSYVGATTSTHVIETTNSSSQKHKDTVHAWPGKKIKLQATANTDYAFVGWFDNAEGTGNALSNNATFETDAPPTASEITYYAKFKETRKLTIYRYLDGSNVSTACGTITINETDSSSGSSTYKVVDKGSSANFSASAASGYSLQGIYTTATGTTPATSPVTLDNNTTYYARFTTNEYNVKANAYYSTNSGSSYTAGDAGGKVTAGSATAGATSTASVKYKSTVNLVATPASGYVFVGWYSAASGGTELSTNTSYTYTLNSAGDVNVYARFVKEDWSIRYGVSGDSNWSTANMSVSDNNVTGTLTLTEGQNFSFKIVKSVRGSETWYAGGGSYSDITSNSFISNLSMSTNGDDTYMKGHAGTYTFTYNKSTNKLSVTASYSDITFTLTDVSSSQWLDNDSPVFWFDANGNGIKMTHQGTNSSNQNYWTVSFPSNTRTGEISIKRNNPNDNTQTWSTFTWTRGYGTSYDAS